MTRILLAPFAASTVALCAEEDWTEDDADIEAACAAWRATPGEAIGVTPATASAVARGLIALANAEDAVAESGSTPSDERRHARHARDGLSTAARRVMSIF